MPMPATHPVADIWPLMTDSELDALAADIRARGQVLPIVRVGGLIIDGRNRWLACERAGIEPLFADVETDDVYGLAKSLNEHRRHAPGGVRMLAAAKLANLQRGDNQHSSIELTSQTDAAKQFDVSVASVKRARYVIDHGSPEVVGAVENGDVAVSLAEKALRRIEDTGAEFTSVADLKNFVRDVWREDHPKPEIRPAPPHSEPVPQSHVSVDTFGVVHGLVRHADEHPVAEAVAEIDKWTRLNILDDLPPAIDYLTELQAALRAKGQ